jgi:hypothetical protein
MHVKRGSGSCGFVINVELECIEPASVAATAAASGGRTRLNQTARTRQGPMAAHDCSGIPATDTAQLRAAPPAALRLCVLTQGACRNGCGRALIARTRWGSAARCAVSEHSSSRLAQRKLTGAGGATAAKPRLQLTALDADPTAHQAVLGWWQRWIGL